MGGGGHLGAAAAEQFGGAVDEGGIDQRLVALHVYSDVFIGHAQQQRGFGQAGGTAGVLFAGEHGFNAVFGAGGGNGGVVGGHDNALRFAQLGALGHAHHHGFAGNIDQSFFR